MYEKNNRNDFGDWSTFWGCMAALIMLIVQQNTKQFQQIMAGLLTLPKKNLQKFSRSLKMCK